ncbi:MAG: biopolymer transporter ExbD [Spirochaetes bacterium]|nr:biopolymer transporter ExbD [Spirochaetota bacterium]
MPRFRRSAKMTSAVSMASMSDIAFLLIIFFLTASVFVIKDGLRLTLPAKGKTMIVKKPEDVCTLILRKDATLLLNDRPVAVADLTETLTETGLTAENLVLLRVEKKARYQDAVTVIEAIKRAGLQKISIKMTE